MVGRAILYFSVVTLGMLLLLEKPVPMAIEPAPLSWGAEQG
jgi:hypothetical protein